MVRGFAILLLCQLAGEVFSRGTGFPVPGPVIGMAVLVLGLGFWSRLRRVKPGDVEGTDAAGVAGSLLQNLGLLFVPAGVGIVEHGAVLEAHALALGLALVVSTAATLLVTVLVFVGVSRIARPAAAEGV